MTAWICRRNAGALILSAALLGACATAPSAPSVASDPSPADPLPAAEVRGPFDTRARVAFAVRPGRLAAEVRYMLRNDGRTPLILFDRGTVHDAGIGRHAPGAVGVPREEVTAEGVTLLHAARALPDPAPTSPPTPMGIELAPGASVTGRFQVMLAGPSLPRNLRWCVGVMPFDKSLLVAPQQTKEGRIWTASFAAAGRQQRLCTPWYDVGRARFEGE